MKNSLVITVLNEEKTIKKLLKSLENQIKKPDETIFVDGGSLDRTFKIIENWKDKFKDLRIKVFLKKGATIAQGRNFGVKKAKGEIIVMTDAGCILHRDWFKKITDPFEKGEVDIVAGFYRMTGETIFQKCLACYLGILPEKLNPKNFMPSARSIAFKKEIWERVGGFNEKLERAGEDTLFNYRAKRLGAKFITVPDALVDWEMPKTWREAIKKFYIYAKGDGQAGIWWDPSKKITTHNLKINTIYLRYFLGALFFLGGFFLKFFWLLLFFAFLIYLLWAVFKNYNYVRKISAIFYLPAIQIVSDFSVMTGFLAGLRKRI
jgi:glycosyltransferase involved in cell wall biosynthesis